MKATPEQIATQQQALLAMNKHDFARLSLGMFATVVRRRIRSSSATAAKPSRPTARPTCRRQGRGRVRREAVRRPEDAPAADAELDGQGAAADDDGLRHAAGRPARARRDDGVTAAVSSRASHVGSRRSRRCARRWKQRMKEAEAKPQDGRVPDVLRRLQDGCRRREAADAHPADDRRQSRPKR